MLPSGLILIWSGSIATIPGGYFLCDGNNGTPDLRDKFVVGAGDTYAVDDTGGSVTHDHAFTSNGHFHTMAGIAAAGVGSVLSSQTTNVDDSGITDAGSTLPPYHSLAYIMKS